jgi:hypothetical protein
MSPEERDAQEAQDAYEAQRDEEARASFARREAAQLVREMAAARAWAERNGTVKEMRDSNEWARESWQWECSKMRSWEEEGARMARLSSG